MTCNGSPVTGLSYIAIAIYKNLNVHYVVTMYGILTKTFYTEMKIYVDKHFQVKITSSSISPEAALASPHPRQGEFK